MPYAANTQGVIPITIKPATNKFIALSLVFILSFLSTLSNSPLNLFKKQLNFLSSSSSVISFFFG
jgi:hypothetical protein